jgi:hypothetical protein
LLGAGYLEQAPGQVGELLVDFTVRAHASTWNDANGNFQFDPPEETRKSWALAAAVTRRPAGESKAEDEGRVIVLADSDALADEVLLGAKVRGNPDFVLDGLKWLLGDEAIAGSTNVETDVPITRTRAQDVVWFFTTVLVAPGLVVGLGLVAVRRGRKRSIRGGAR